jgi:Holliday junction resolvasome RuvABC DNA-binding subunit
MLEPNSQPTDQMDVGDAVIGLAEDLLKVAQQSKRTSDAVKTMANLLQEINAQHLQNKAITMIALKKAGFSKEEINEIRTQVEKEYTSINTRIDLDLLFNK